MTAKTSFIEIKSLVHQDLYVPSLCVCVGMGPVHMNEVECSGFEKSLTECYFNKEALGCSHEEDAAVKCNIPAMGFHNRVYSIFNSN